MQRSCSRRVNLKINQPLQPADLCRSAATLSRTSTATTMNVVASAAIFPSAHQEVGVVLNTFAISASSELKQLITEAAPEEEPLFVELFFAVHFAIRQLSNLGDGPDATALASRLQRFRYEEHETTTTISDSEGTFVNIDHPQQRDGKKIAVELLIGGQNAQLQIKNTGFGFMNRKLWADISKSVVALFLALAAKHPENRSFIRRILLACGEVTRQWNNKQISLSNHTQVALLSTMGLWSVSVEGEYTEDRPGL